MNKKYALILLGRLYVASKTEPPGKKLSIEQRIPKLAVETISFISVGLGVFEINSIG